MRRLALDLTGTRSLEAALERVRSRAEGLPEDAWIVGRGWYNDAWPVPAFPNRRQLDEAAGGRPVHLARKDGHSVWVSSAALRAARIRRSTPDPPGGLIDRDARGSPTGILRERAVEMTRRVIPPVGEEDLDRALAAVLRSLARLGLTCVHSMDTVRGFGALQRLHAAGRLPIRVVFNLPAAALAHAERLGLRSGWGDAWLRVWGVKAFLDGSLGSRTAEMLDGRGVAVLPQKELVELAESCAAAELNVCLHAIGDGAVRRALDALEPLKGAWPRWRPRIEHAQCVHPSDRRRFLRAGVIASMQPIHAVSDRPLAEREWSRVGGRAYAWGALKRAGAVLAFGSDAPVEDADPLKGLDAATGWRRRVGWHPELALDRRSALRAYTLDAAYAAGLERELGALSPGRYCDLTVVERSGPRPRVSATVVGGRLRHRR